MEVEEQRNGAKVLLQVLSTKMEVVQFDQQLFKDQHNTLTRIIRECGIEVCDISSGKRKSGKDMWWWNSETEKVVKVKRNALKSWKQTRMVIDREEYRRCSKIARKVIGRARQLKQWKRYIKNWKRKTEKIIFIDWKQQGTRRRRIWVMCTL